MRYCKISKTTITECDRTSIGIGCDDCKEIVSTVNVFHCADCSKYNSCKKVSSDCMHFQYMSLKTNAANRTVPVNEPIIENRGKHNNHNTKGLRHCKTV